MTPIERLTAALAREPHIANVNHGVYRDDLAAVLAVVEAAQKHVAWEYRQPGAPRFTLTNLLAALAAPDPALLDPWVDGYEAGEYEARAALDVARLLDAVQRHQDNHAYEGKTLRWHCGGSDCGREIAREYAKEPQS